MDANTNKNWQVILGIDFGTTQCKLAYMDEFGQTNLIHNRDGAVATPSAVYFSQDGKVLVGQHALNNRILEPERVVYAVKRYLGSNNWTYRHPDTGERLSAVDIASKIFSALKEDAERHLGHEVSQAVVTVPANAGDGQRGKTREAAEMAGLKVLQIINEPEAAAIAYAGTRSLAASLLMVFDFGGGTFDVTILKTSPDRIEVKGTTGVSDLGGTDIDQSITQLMCDRFREQHGYDPIAEDRRARLRFEETAISIKHALSSVEQETREIFAGDRAITVELSRSTFNRMIDPDVSRALDACKEALRMAKVGWKDIDDVILVGGSSMIPYVTEKLESVSGKTPRLMPAPGPIQAVAFGAAYIRAEAKAKSSFTVDLRTSRHLGVIAAKGKPENEYFHVLIPANKEIPTKKTQFFTTLEDNQRHVIIFVVEGLTKDLDRAEKIGSPQGYELSGLRPMKRNEPQIYITLEYDNEQRVLLSAVEKKSGAKLDVTVVRELLPEVESTGSQIVELENAA